MGKEKDLVEYIFSLPKERLDGLRGSPQKVLEAIDEYAKIVPIPIVGEAKGRVILEEMLKIEPNIMIEVGGYVGYSAILFGSELQKYNRPLTSSSVPSKFFSFEGNCEFADIASTLIDLAGLTECVEVIVGRAGHTLPDFEARVSAHNKHYTSVDFVFFNHWIELYVPDLRMLESLSLVSPGTVICADNILDQGASGYREYVKGSPEERKAFNAAIANKSALTCIGRWNIIYKTKTVNFQNLESEKDSAVEVTTCVAYLSG